MVTETTCATNLLFSPNIPRGKSLEKQIDTNDSLSNVFSLLSIHLPLLLRKWKHCITSRFLLLAYTITQIGKSHGSSPILIRRIIGDCILSHSPPRPRVVSLQKSFSRFILDKVSKCKHCSPIAVNGDLSIARTR